jgi:hypothetical protein
MLVLLQRVGVAKVPLKVRVLGPWVLPKLEPEIVTDEPIGPEEGDKLAILGAPSATLTVVVLAALTRFDGFAVGKNPDADTEIS